MIERQFTFTVKGYVEGIMRLWRAIEVIKIPDLELSEIKVTNIKKSKWQRILDILFYEKQNG